MDAPRSGSRLLDELQGQAAADPRFAELSIEPAPCLYNCQRDCSVHVRARGKPGYIIEGLATGAGSAAAVLQFVAAHMESPDGVATEANQPDALLGRVVRGEPPRYLG